MNAAFENLGGLLRAGGGFGRGALVLSLVVHGGIAAAFVGWGEPSVTPTELVAITVVAIPAPGDTASIATAASTPSGPPHLPAEIPPPSDVPSADAEPAPVQLAEAPSAPKEPGPETLPDLEMAPEPAPAGEPAPTAIDDRPVATAPPVKPSQIAAAPAAATPPADVTATENAVLSDQEMAAEPDSAGSQLASLPPAAPASDDDAIDPDPAIAREPAFEPARYDVAALGNPKPDYPYLSRSRGEQGRVVLRVEVTATGDVASIEISDSSGHRRLDEAALDAVAQWRFEPARVGDDPIATTVNVPITFRIEN